MIQQVIFLAVALFTSLWGYKLYKQVIDNIRLGKAEAISGDAGLRWKNVFLIAFGQKKMFKNLIPAVFHLFIYVAFLLTQIEFIEIILDGITGHHRLFAPLLGGLYTIIINLIEVLSLLALIATFIFLYRRNLLKIPRFVKSELNGWPRLDANNILIGELILATAIFLMNSADGMLQQMQPSHYPDTGHLALSSWIGSVFWSGASESTLVFSERFGWWLHVLIVFAFILYLPVSKHFHIFLAFPNVYFSRLQPRGEMDNMPAIMNEVKGMFGLSNPESEASEETSLEFGAKDVFDLSWKTILDAYTCTECGRCTAECPANLTGKKLSPRKIMMDIRDRVTEVGGHIAKKDPSFYGGKSPAGSASFYKDNYADGKSLFDYISREEIHACTTCNACVEACPVMINPVLPILEMRRHEILTESAGPPDWLPMFTAMENSGCVWQMPDEREKWRTEVV